MLRTKRKHKVEGAHISLINNIRYGSVETKKYYSGADLFVIRNLQVQHLRENISKTSRIFEFYWQLRREM